MAASPAPALPQDRTDTDAVASADVAAPVVPDTLPAELTDERSPSRAAQTSAQPARTPIASLSEVVAQYGQYVALFVGAGLVSGSVVHFPLAPVRYAIIGAVGGAIFAAASILTDRAGKDTAAIARVAIASLVLALGIGMVSGSIQHFQDIPARAAQLIPLGIVLSVPAFIIRNGLRPKSDDLAAIALWTATAAVVLTVGLGDLAERVTSEGAGDKPAKSEGKRSEGDKAAASEASDGHAH